MLEKFKESLSAVLPIMGILLVLSFTIVPMPVGILTAFLFGGLLLIVGMMFFTLGAELAMAPMGEKMGSSLTKTKSLVLILPLTFFLGFMITISEPDLQVLANQVQSVPGTVLICSVAAGVGIFLVIALLRMLFSVSLSMLLMIFYSAIFVLAFFVPQSFIAVAFDAGGVTTGPMTVPFIMAFGMGISAIRNDINAADDSFGLVALCSIGPILAVMIMGLIYRPESAEYTVEAMPSLSYSTELGKIFAVSFPEYMKDIALALLPIVLFFTVFQIIRLRLEKKTLIRVCTGIVYTYVGLVLFLTGANVGFMPAGNYLGKTLASYDYKYIIIPIGMLIGYFIVKAEPAVYVLMRQVEEITDGAVKGSALQISLSVGMAVSIGISMLRVLTGISLLWFVIPGYALALLLSFFTPKIFTAIAFDSGGVASGPMTAAFLLPLAVGACISTGGNIITDAFGVVAMVAMTPLISIQILGLIYNVRPDSDEASEIEESDVLGVYDIIEL